MRILYKTGPMESLRKWFYKPKRDDRSLLAQFFFADDALNMIAAELDSFDGRKDPDRCSTLVNQLRHAQDRVLNITSQIMDQVLGEERVARGFRVKFPEDVLQDNLAGQLWFGAECLAAGSSIMNHEEESAAMRPLAKALTRSLETVRALLREHCLRPRAPALDARDDMLHESLRIFDRLFAEFELCYVSAMVVVKTPREFEAQQLICVLFSESLRQALERGLLTQEQVDSYDPALMFAVPRLAIVSGLLRYPSGPLAIDKPFDEMSDMFRPFRTLLHKIRTLLWTLDRRELAALERLLCTNEDISNLASLDLPPVSENAEEQTYPYPDLGEFVSKYYGEHEHCHDMYSQSSSEHNITEADYLPDNIEVMMPIIDGLRRLTEVAEDDEKQDSECDTQDAQTNKANELPANESTENTDTFQSNNRDLEGRVRKTSRSESSDLASLRNLSTSGLMMFDPLVINAVSNSSSSDIPRQLPDHELVTSLNEQVCEIADRLSSIVTNDVDLLEQHTHSFSANDVPGLIMTDYNSDSFVYTGPRSEQLPCLPSTSHGYLIPNAISQEPVVLASLSHNNSAVFNSNDENIDINGTILNDDLPLIIPDMISTEIANNNMSVINTNLSSLLLTKEESAGNFVDSNEIASEDASFHSAKMALDKDEDNDKVKFHLGYESEHESPVDSGVSTDNTSLDRSPDADLNKDIKDFNCHSKKLDEVPSNNKDEIEVKLDKENDGSVDKCTKETEIDEAKSPLGTDNVNDNLVDKDKNLTDKDETTNVNNEPVDIYYESRTTLQNWGIINVTEDDYRHIENTLAELRKRKKPDRSNIVEEEDLFSTFDLDAHTSRSSSSRYSRSRRSKGRKKRSKAWSPGNVILDNRSMHSHNGNLKFNWDLYVEGSTSDGYIDDEQIALALQAQEIAARKHARKKFKSSEDLIHRLFVCIAGVADQLQTNFAADLRNILKAVFLMNQTPEPEPSARSPAIEYEVTEDQVIQNGSSFDSIYSAEEVYADNACESPPAAREDVREEGRRLSEDIAPAPTPASPLQPSASVGDLTSLSSAAGGGAERAPEWVPDVAAPACMLCEAHFTAFRRRHHCRNCGKVFCASCSSNSIPLPRYGQLKPVRVCELCFAELALACRR